MVLRYECEDVGILLHWLPSLSRCVRTRLNSRSGDATYNCYSHIVRCNARNWDRWVDESFLRACCAAG